MNRNEGYTITDVYEYFQDNMDFILELTVQHINLVGLAIIVAILIGVPLGIYLTTNESLAGTVLNVASVIMTIPSIALFGLMIPIFSLINQGIGFVPAFVALVLYSQLPIIRNTYTAINNVNPEIRDAAMGIGMSTAQRLLKVEIPNTLPVIMAGIRTAVVLNIGIGVIAAFIGAGGLGILIAQGITRGHTDMVIAGAIAISILGISADLILRLLQRIFTSKGVSAQ
ncbi:ABC transporter permease [Tenuibacillus multivorans]|uniref:Osmoprotectant transport system permease protein n=1 Tax=Tenuibacillus multivorans TaxID=237069 RepID=A0A1H0DKI1_9BACI|nr:ABC transporter permease [Tenuibacillus multivorans]GEL76511.1 choline ABC transporter permease [Tenuibacillus multivorans]SDN70757.1 osmoprotectant transport system permease protein [Tenuibacillus multivorans]